MKISTMGATAITLALVGLTPALAANATPVDKTTICHATGSESNPWEMIEVPAPSLGAHDGHGDLIPAPATGCPAVLPDEEPAEDDPEVVPPVLNCEPGTVPGWLDESGNATSCVSDNPCPEVEFGQPCPGDVPPVVTPPTVELPTIEPPSDVTPALEPVEMLAETGSDSGDLLLVGGIVLAVGIAFLVGSIVGRRSGVSGGSHETEGSAR